MNKATFVNEIPSKIEGNEVPTVELVQKIIDQKEIKSENISDRIKEYCEYPLTDMNSENVISANAVRKYIQIFLQRPVVDEIASFTSDELNDSSHVCYILLGYYSSVYKNLEIYVRTFANQKEQNLYILDVKYNDPGYCALKVMNINETGDDTKDSEFGTIHFALSRVSKDEKTYLAIKIVKANVQSSLDIKFFIFGLDINEDLNKEYTEVIDSSQEYYESSLYNVNYTVYTKFCFTQPNIP